MEEFPVHHALNMTIAAIKPKYNLASDKTDSTHHNNDVAVGVGGVCPF